MERFFVDKNSIVRKIWGSADTVLFIFAGAAAEFALNKAVDWLYFTGRLPADPLGRLFSTVTYSRQIIFSKEETALRSIDQITAIHKGVEKHRGSQIPDWAYRDVLFMLIDYSIRSFELLERELEIPEKTEVFWVFHRVGGRMNLTGLPASYDEYCIMRTEHLAQNLISSKFTIDLYGKYRDHLRPIRYAILKQVQAKLVPAKVKALLPFGNIQWITPLLVLYKALKSAGLEKPFKNALLPAAYKDKVKAMDNSGTY